MVIVGAKINEKMKIIIRIMLLPFVIIFSVLLLIAGSFCIFLPVIVLGSVLCIITMPIIWLFNKSGTNINYIEPIPLTDIECNYLITNIVNATVYLWFIPYTIWLYIVEGEIFGIDIFDK